MRYSATAMNFSCNASVAAPACTAMPFTGKDSVCAAQGAALAVLIFYARIIVRLPGSFLLRGFWRIQSAESNLVH